MSKRSQQIAAWFQQGRQLHAAGRLAEADQVYREILRRSPGHADSLHMLGVLALQAGQPEAALAQLDRAIAADPSRSVFHANRANALLALGRAEEAEAACRTGLRHKRNSIEALQTLGHALSELDRADEAVDAYRQALAQRADLPDIHAHIGLALAQGGRYDEAVTAMQQAVRQSPHDPLARLNLGGTLKDAGQLADAEAVCRDILDLNPRSAPAHHNLGMILLQGGRFAEAWPEWEWRFQADPSIARNLAKPLWRGEPLNGRTLLVHSEQGIGDAIQFCRYLRFLPRDGRIVVELPASLTRLVRRTVPDIAVVALNEALPGHDLRCPIMSLPLALNRPAPSDIPAEFPYFAVDQQTTSSWRERLAPLSGLKIGLAWAGNPDRVAMDRRRSIPLVQWENLLTVPDAAFISLQKGPAAAQLPATAFAGRMADWTAELNDFADTAALIDALDLVIGVDTAVVHLAGALGKPVWLLNRADTDWRWQLGRDDSPWYPSLRQFRQTRARVWEDVIERVRDALADLARQHAAPAANTEAQLR
jgi:tetratricopeptide (TPR) repeat protein